MPNLTLALRFATVASAVRWGDPGWRELAGTHLAHGVVLVEERVVELDALRLEEARQLHVPAAARSSRSFRRAFNRALNVPIGVSIGP